MRIALISFHTSPLATLGGKDTGGMNVYVRDVARELGRRGIATDIFTRSQGSESLRIDPRLGTNVRVIHVPAGPEAPLLSMCFTNTCRPSRSGYAVSQPSPTKRGLTVPMT